MTDLEEIGKNIVLLRSVQGLTQEEVAYRSRLSVSRLQAIEYGCRNTTADTLIHIAGTLGIDSRVFGIFSRPDSTILSEVRRVPKLPEQGSGPLQICRNILLLRESMGLTQRQLAQRSAISISCLRDIEHGCENVTTNKLLSIAGAFEMSLAELNNLTMSEKELMELVYAARAAAGMLPPKGDALMQAAADSVRATSYRKPLRITEVFRAWNGDRYPVCPRCRITLDREYQAYCDRCGQCLDWRGFRKARVITVISAGGNETAGG